MPYRIGLDVGGVILSRQELKTKKARRDLMKKQPLVKPNALEVIEKWFKQGHILYIVSYCQEAMERKAKMDLYSLHIESWIPDERWFFVRKRHEKGKICSREKLHFMLNDHLDVLEAVRLQSPLTQCLLFDDSVSALQKKDKDKAIRVVQSWSTLLFE